MSSLRNAVKRRTHKERSQPSERKKYGLLEKHKDYVLRARDFHAKENTLKALKLKASFRNPDEFYFGMEKQRTRGGVHVSSGKQWTADEVALMGSQDIRYVRTKLQSERKKVERLEASLHRVDAAGDSSSSRRSAGDAAHPRHVVFETSDGEDEARVAAPAAAAAADDREDGEGAGLQGLHASGDDEDGRESKPEAQRAQLGRPLPARLARRRAAAYAEVEERRGRVQRLSAVLQQMELQRALAGKGRKRKVEPSDSAGGNNGAAAGASGAGDGATAAVYKWKRQRLQ